MRAVVAGAPRLRLNWQSGECAMAPIAPREASKERHHGQSPNVAAAVSLGPTTAGQAAACSKPCCVARRERCSARTSVSARFARAASDDGSTRADFARAP